MLIGACVEGCVRGDGVERNLVRMSGSTSMERLSDAWAEDFMGKDPDIRVTTEFVGSSAGIGEVLSGGADIGMSSRWPGEEEKAEGAVENLVALDGIAVCVDLSNTVGGLTCGQLTDIYTGAVQNWAELGGADIPVVVIGREAGSGTRSAFEETLGISDRCSHANELDSAGAVMARVASTPGAIGYVSLGVVDDSVKKLSLEGVEPAAENIRNGSYLLTSPFVMVTRGEIGEQKESVRKWFDYIYSEEGQAVVERLGFIIVKQAHM
ncbi:MAG: phosphate ABC transporter substrate-binding protein [Lachnospiraceae bacterium]|nr:phosphate ABC transporter substrate-binding protein [Lachnospiraceae bacterium]MCM1240241.1 phosphate ABC transporter substrate-binding protein [Lachnospiraceae bacterium]